VIVPDCDEAGAHFAHAVARDLYPGVYHIHVMDLEGTDGYDVADFIADHSAFDLIRRRTSHAPLWKPAPKTPPRSPLRKPPRRMLRHRGAGLPYDIADLAVVLGARIRPHGGKAVVYCPAHDDERSGHPGLSLTSIDDEHTLAYCHSGCEFTDIAMAVKELMNE
jgi:hypothetical protein